MKKTLSFEKDLTFQMMIGEITTISLDDDLKFTDPSNIEGNFYVSGKYKMTEASSIEEEFSYNIPISIALVQTLDLNTTKINIVNFIYEVIDGKTLRCKIDLLVEGVEKIEMDDNDIIEEETQKVRECDDDIVPEELKELNIKDNKNNDRFENEEDIVSNNSIKVDSLFANLGDESDTFTTYSVYIMRENDSIEKVMDKYKVDKEQLQDYNDLSKIELNSKVIIPTVTSENE